MITYHDICGMIRKKEPFTLSRFGDGEWRAITQESGSNCDGHAYYPDMCDELADIIRGRPWQHHNYFVGCHLLSSERHKKETLQWLDCEGINPQWSCDSNIFHMAIKDDVIDRLRWSLRRHRVVIVGPNYLKELKMHNIFIPVSEVNCWNDTRFVLSELEKHKGKKTVLFCASMAANVWIDQVRGMYPTLIDAGSALDYFAEKPTRSFIRKALRRKI